MARGLRRCRDRRARLSRPGRSAGRPGRAGRRSCRHEVRQHARQGARGRAERGDPRSGAAPGRRPLSARTAARRSPALDPEAPLAEFRRAMLAPFFAGDALEGALAAICGGGFRFPGAAGHARSGPAGPAGARAVPRPDRRVQGFRRALPDGLPRPARRAGDPLHVLVATSGDTGGAVGCAAEGRGIVRAVDPLPQGRVSPFQEQQLTCWGEPVRALEVEGDFDDCQRLVKAAFADPDLPARQRLTSANSINYRPAAAANGLSRAMPRSRVFAETGEKPGL